MKTNAMRILESLSIPYKIHSYEWDEEHLDAVHAAESAGLDTERVFKTIVMRTSDKRIFVFCLPAVFDISLKKARALADADSIELVRQSELLSLTGYVRGGCSPLGMKKHYRTFIEETALLYQEIYVSAGQRGLQLEVNPELLCKAAEAVFADFT